MEHLYNLNIERAILSHIFFEPETIETLSTQLGVSDFYLPFHQYVYMAMDELSRAEKPIDEEFVRAALMKMGKWDEVAMIEVLSSSPISNTFAYIKNVREMALKRSLASLGTYIKKEVIENDENPLDIIDSIIRKAEHIAEGGTLTINRKNLNDIEAKDQEFLVKNWIPIPKGTLSMFTAPGGTGKTWLSLQLSSRIVEEDPTEKVFLWLSEDPEGTVGDRRDGIQQSIRSMVDSQKLNRRIDISMDDPLVLLETRGQVHTISSKFYAMKRELREYTTIIIDPLLAFFGGDENSNSQARIFMQAFINWCRREKKTIVFLHHSKKSDVTHGSKSRGAGAIVDAVRCVYDMEHITILKDGKQQPDPHSLGKRRFTLTKDNYGAARYTDGFIFERVITPAKSAGVIEIVYEDSLYMPKID